MYVLVHVRSRVARRDGTFNYDFVKEFNGLDEAMADTEIRRAVDRGCILTINTGQDEDASVGHATARAIVRTLNVRDHEAEGEASTNDLLDAVAALDELVGWERAEVL